MILTANSVSKSFGDNNLFNNVSFNIEKGDKIGLIGANGVGKTTLFKILIRQEDCDSGSVIAVNNSKIGYLEQHVCEAGEKTALEEVLEVFKPLIEIENRLKEINNLLLTENDEKLIEKQHILTEKFQNDGGLTYLSRAKSALSGLGFSEEKQNMPTAKLSGGQRSKIGLCKLLLSQNDLLLLDEPTNHLDIESIEWLEEYIKNYRGAVMVISHDRYFLDAVTNRTMELEHSACFIANGNYSRYLQLKKEREESEQRAYDNTMNEVRRIEKIIEQQKRWNREKNIKTAESKQKEIDRLTKDLVRPETENINIDFTFKAKNDSGNDVLSAENLSVGFQNETLFYGVNLDVKKGDRSFIIGDNGIGKTTLIKMLIKGGKGIKYGVGVKVGYFDQHEENLNLNNTAFEELRYAYPNKDNTELRSALAKFLFRGDDVFKLLRDSSGGERAKVSLCKLMLSGANLMFLDEPTNHLDLWSREALEKALQSFDGTLIVVSHDRYFINKLAKKILWLKKDGIHEINGNWDDWYLSNRQKETEEKKKKELSDEGKRYYKEKARQADVRRLKSQLRNLENRISQLECEIDEKNEQLNDEKIATDYEAAIEITNSLQAMNDELEQCMNLWETLSEELV